MEVGYIGLGVMGGALARRLLLSRSLHVFDLKAESVDAFSKLGAKVASSPSELAVASDVVMLCLPRSAHVRAVIFGENGLAQGLRPGCVIVDQTSGDPTETRRMAAELKKLGIGMVDAPVSGGTRGAEAGTISIMTGGSDEALDKVQSILEQISPNIFRCGEIGAGQVMKLINNTISTCNRFAMLEGVAMGLRNGLDLGTMTDVLNSGGARSKSSENMLPALVRGKPDSFFLLSLMLKDLNLATELAVETGVPLLFGQMARGMLQSASNALGPEANLFEISEYVAAQTGISFESTGSKEDS